MTPRAQAHVEEHASDLREAQREPCAVRREGFQLINDCLSVHGPNVGQGGAGRI